jgi:hypothetical protein
MILQILAFRRPRTEQGPARRNSRALVNSFLSSENTPVPADPTLLPACSRVASARRIAAPAGSGFLERSSGVLVVQRFTRKEAKAVGNTDCILAKAATCSPSRIPRASKWRAAAVGEEEAPVRLDHLFAGKLMITGPSGVANERIVLLSGHTIRGWNQCVKWSRLWKWPRPSTPRHDFSATSDQQDPFDDVLRRDFKWLSQHGPQTESLKTLLPNTHNIDHRFQVW